MEAQDPPIMDIVERLKRELRQTSRGAWTGFFAPDNKWGDGRIASARGAVNRETGSWNF